jgi:hypothetical protein
MCAGIFHALSSENVVGLRDSLIFSIESDCKTQIFKIASVASVGAVLIGSASVASDAGMTAELTNSRSGFNRDGLGVRSDRNRDPREWYSLLGIAKVNGSRVAVFALQNGVGPDDVAGPGRDLADVLTAPVI